MNKLHAEALSLWTKTWEDFADELKHTDANPTDQQIEDASRQIADAIQMGHEQEYILQVAHHAGATFRTDLDYFLPR